MKVIRRGVFETNSSSTHSITMCAKEDYDKWKNGELLLNQYGGGFLTKEEAIKELGNDYKNLSDDELNDMLDEDDWYSYKRYFSDSYLETFSDTYTTKSGEVIIAFGQYGYDG